MQPITINKTLKIIKLWLAGLSYDEISQQTGVSKGKIHDVIQDLKNGLIPFNRNLKKAAAPSLP